MVIFGATGDLTQRKLLPALYNLALERLLPPHSRVVGVARRPKTDEQFREQALDAVNAVLARRPVDPTVWDNLRAGLLLPPVRLRRPDGYHTPQRAARADRRERGTGGNRLFYLATPPSFYRSSSSCCGEPAIADGGLHRARRLGSRIIIEKPFGHDLPVGAGAERGV